MQNMEQSNLPSARWTPDQIPMYEENPRTVRVAARSEAKNTAMYALELCGNSPEPVEFLYIGASAGQQAAKAMGIFRYKVDEVFNGTKTALFHPNRVRVVLNNGENQIVDAFVWRAYVVPVLSLSSYK